MFEGLELPSLSPCSTALPLGKSSSLSSSDHGMGKGWLGIPMVLQHAPGCAPTTC